MEENTHLPKEVELITEDRLKELGFEFVDYGDNPPYETYRKDGIEVSEYNGECWLIEMLDQNNIERPIKYLSELEAFFNGCGKSIYGATAYATKHHQANETIKVLEYDNNKLKGEAEGVKNAVEELTFESDKQRTEANEQLRGAKKLLNEVFRKHESGLLPDRFIYEKIKTFLYGE